jgi:hypothetical protein
MLPIGDPSYQTFTTNKPQLEVGSDRPNTNTGPSYSLRTTVTQQIQEETPISSYAIPTIGGGVGAGFIGGVLQICLMNTITPGGVLIPAAIGAILSAYCAHQNLC